MAKITIQHDELAALVTQAFTNAGISEADAAMVADSLVDANLVGHDSHGVVRLRGYLKQIRLGNTNAESQLETLNETGSLVVCDAKASLGQVAMRQVIDKLLPKVREQGVGSATVINCGHVGRLGEWTERIASRGFSCLMSVTDNGVLKCVAPPGGKRPTISTNPLSIGIPTATGPMAVDISTSAVANGKVLVARAAGEDCPPGWLIDAEGNPTTDPNVRYTEPRGSLLPMGGEQGYKGFGLGVFLDFLVAGLSGGFCPPAPDGATGYNNVLLVAWDPESHSGSTHMHEQVERLAAFVRDCPTVEDAPPIRLPGDRTQQCRRERLKSGIPIDESTYDEIKTAALGD